MDELTIEKIKEWRTSPILLVIESCAKDAPYQGTEQLFTIDTLAAIDFLLAECERKEKQTAERCAELAEEPLLEWISRGFVIESSARAMSTDAVNNIRKEYNLN